MYINQKKDFDLQKEPIAYIRLRWGSLYCEVPFNGRTVYKYNFDDSYKGMMEEEERKLHLSSIDNAIFKFLNSKTLKS